MGLPLHWRSRSIRRSLEALTGALEVIVIRPAVDSDTVRAAAAVLSRSERRRAGKVSAASPSSPHAGSAIRSSACWPRFTEATAGRVGDGYNSSYRPGPVCGI